MFFIVYFFVFKIKNKQYFSFEKVKYNKLKEICILFKEGIPFILSSIILPLSLVIDSFLIINILKYLGFEKGFATSLLGMNSGIINTLVSLPTAICSGFSVVIIPYIAFALNRNDYKGISEKMALSIKFTIFLCLPCVLFFGVFSKEILTLLYSHSFAGEYALNLTSTILTISSINVLYLSFLQITTSFLQAINKSYIPVLSLSIALIFKVIAEVILISNPFVNIAGAVISNSICYATSSLINLYFIRKEVKVKFSFYKTIICPILCTLIACFCSVVLLKVIFVSTSFLNIIISFVLSAIVYFVFLFLLKGLSNDEIKIMFVKSKKNV